MMPPVAVRDCGRTIIYLVNPSSGFSEPVTKEIQINDIANKIAKETNKNNEKSVYLGVPAELRNVVLDYHSTRNSEGWDGYDARPITEVSKNTALAIIALLPAGIQMPDIIPVAAGGYSFEWDTQDATFSLVVENRELIWSFISFGGLSKRKRSGMEEEFAGVLPDDVLMILKSEFKAA
jgi:hypothetical protein